MIGPAAPLRAGFPERVPTPFSDTLLNESSLSFNSESFYLANLNFHEAKRDGRPGANLDRRLDSFSMPATTKAVRAPEDLGIARGLTRKKRDRLYAYERYLAILNEGVEDQLEA